jgi:hypothetical protein
MVAHVYIGIIFIGKAIILYGAPNEHPRTLLSGYPVENPLRTVSMQQTPVKRICNPRFFPNQGFGSVSRQWSLLSQEFLVFYWNQKPGPLGQVKIQRLYR